MNVRTTFVKPLLLNFLLLASVAAVWAESEAIDDGRQAFYKGQYQQAEKYFLINLDDPELKDEALMYLSRIAMETGDTDQAVEYIERVLKATPDNTEVVILSADTYCQHAQNSSIFKALKIAKQCIAQYESAIELDSNNIEALMSAARFHLHAPSVAGGSSKKAREFMEQLNKLSPEHGITVNIDWHEKEGERDTALKLAGQLAEKGFQFPQNQYDLAKYYKHVKAYDKALPLFEQMSTREKTYQNQWVINDSLLQAGEIHIAEGENIAKGIKLIEDYKQVNNNPYDVHYFWSTWSLAKGYKAIGQHDKYQMLINEIQAEEYSRDKAFAKEFEAAL